MLKYTFDISTNIFPINYSIIYHQYVLIHVDKGNENIMGTASKQNNFYRKSYIAWSLNGNIISINLYDEIVKLQACFFVKCLCKMCQNACAYYTQWNDDGVVSIVKWDMILRTCLLLSCNMSSVIEYDASNMFLNVILQSIDDEIPKIWFNKYFIVQFIFAIS